WLAVSVFARAIRPPDPVTPNDNPAGVPPASVGPPDARPGGPNGVQVDPGIPGIPPPTIRPSAWSGWPGEWATPNWNGRASGLTDIAWKCLDLNASLLATMPPYLVGASPNLDADWLVNPDRSIYTSWEEFAKQLFWGYQLGEVFVLSLARYATGWPARFRVIAPWAVNVEMADGVRVYSIGGRRTDDILHIRNQSTT